MLAARRKQTEKDALRRQEAERAARERVVTWSLRLPKPLNDALKAMAKAERRSANRQIEVLIQEAVDRRREQATPGASHESLAAGTTPVGS